MKGAAARARLGSEAGALLLLAVATTVLTWPLVASSGQALSIREDYFLNLWNLWWVREALAQGLPLHHTDHLLHPVGVSLARHVLNPVSAIPGAWLSTWLDLHDVYKAIVWVHFWLSAWVFSLFARALTGSPGGALLAGLFWSFGPFHYFYLAQLNVLSMEFLPLAGLFLVQSYRVGGVANALGVGAAAALLAGSSPYSLVYAALLGATLLAAGPLWARGVAWRLGALRLVAAAAVALAAVVLVSWRTLLEGGLGAADEASGRQLVERANDLVGFLWVVPPERILVAWPAMLGYSSLVLVVLGVARERARLFWLGFALCAWLLSLGNELHVAGNATGVPLPYRIFAELPVLWMLRKPDRIFVLVLLGAGVLLAFGWRELAARLASPAARRAVWLAFAVAICLERAVVPLETFALSTPAYLERLARDDSVRAIVELPPYGGGAAAAGANHWQTVHGKPVTQGYVVNLALDRRHHRASRQWHDAYQKLESGDARPLVRRAQAAGVDRVLLRKRVPVIRRPDPLDGRTLWAPFTVHGRRLVELRQIGLFGERALAPGRLALLRAALIEGLGEPDFEDEQVLAFRVPPAQDASTQPAPAPTPEG